MSRRILAVVTALVASSCSLIAPSEEPPATTSPTPPVTSEPTTTTSEVTPGLTTIDCPAPDSEFAILCEAVELIRTNYVDPIEMEMLAEGAVLAVEQMEAGDESADPLRCALPEPEVFLDLCVAIDERDTDPLEAVETAVAGMIHHALDPNSVYLSPAALELTEEDQTGQVEGIGALVTTEDLESDDPESTPCAVISDTCRLVIVSTLEGSPAKAAGLLPDDQMVTVEGVPIAGRSFDEVTTEVRGPAGTEVTIEFLRGAEIFAVTITRAAIEIPVASWEMVGNTGYLRLYLFTLNADEQVRLALEELLAAGAERIVLDLRDNPGGALTTSIAVASEFLDDGLVLKTEAPGQEIPYEVQPGGVLTDPEIPLVIILNRGSASASEVVSGALQEAGRAVIVGEPSFGKNTVQQRFSLSNGGAVKLTIARWVTPQGNDFGGDGIQPDVSVELETDQSVPEIVAAALAAAGL